MTRHQKVEFCIHYKGIDPPHTSRILASKLAPDQIVFGFTCEDSDDSDDENASNGYWTAGIICFSDMVKGPFCCFADSTQCSGPVLENMKWRLNNDQSNALREKHKMKIWTKHGFLIGRQMSFYQNHAATRDARIKEDRIRSNVHTSNQVTTTRNRSFLCAKRARAEDVDEGDDEEDNEATRAARTLRGMRTANAKKAKSAKNAKKAFRSFDKAFRELNNKYYITDVPENEWLEFSKNKDHAACNLIGRHILYNFDEFGWCNAQIVDRNRDDKDWGNTEGDERPYNFIVFCDIDKTYAHVLLTPEAYHNEDVDSWVLLDRVEMFGGVDDAVEEAVEEAVEDGIGEAAKKAIDCLRKKLSLHDEVKATFPDFENDAVNEIVRLVDDQRILVTCRCINARFGVGKVRCPRIYSDLIHKKMTVADFVFEATRGLLDERVERENADEARKRERIAWLTLPN